ncbi:Ferric uptake regulation protein [Sedimentisphaera cyanobacteriorum]|uniref:Ferric uptake regulation protein n=1 Tax=Sedimentisphaera cyanobacteriorum TaxID=1940790 RepID=A0A1Q2HNP1_9BACT|nr:transcriptional repressor [Sedimentisphaera cyanobacteriorum]AQQ09067.1 Ferric uptake regulation protein [Sedimentisphaera cyanobacteriorum]
MDLRRKNDSPEKTLKEYGLNCTKSQIKVLKVLLSAENPLARGDIISALGSRKIDKVTVYRILERFCEKGLVHKAYLDKRDCEYELADRCSKHQCHPHFKCIKCGRVICLYDEKIPLIESRRDDLVFLRQKTVIEGIGPECFAQGLYENK